MLVSAHATSEAKLISELADLARTPRLRTIGEFAEQEIILADGPYQGRRFKLSRSPVARLFFREFDADRWQRIFCAGPNQDGKTLVCTTIPTLYRLFERGETVLMGAPSLEIAADKWTIDLKPTILASKYKDLLPTSGGGSRDGESVLYTFKNGARLRFMTAGGGDQSRAAFTTPNLHVTETDGFDTTGSASREGDKFSQLERRLLAYGSRARTLAECTVSIERGRTWQEIQNGTASRIAIPCAHCGAYVTPEREHLKGWQAAGSEQEAIDKTHLCCPSCGAVWTNEERIEANRHAVLAHKGQTVDREGRVTGEPPRTNTLGFRWTVVNSILNPERLQMVGGEEWRAKHAPDEDAADRDLCQKQWALPAKPAGDDPTLNPFTIIRRTRVDARGMCPPGTQCVTVGIDIGKWWLHWTAIAWLPNATAHVVDYGVIKVPSDHMAVEEAILQTLRQWRDETVMIGWKGTDRQHVPTFAFVDCGNWRDTICLFTNEADAPFFPTAGYGFGQRRDGERYKRDTGSKVIGAGDGYAYIQQPNGQKYVEVKADHWKTWLHARIQTPVDKAGAFTLYHTTGNDHLEFANHLTAERRVEEFDPKHGVSVRWVSPGRKNHWLDSTTLACVAGHEAGMRLLEVVPPEPPPRRPTPANDGPAWVPEVSNWLNR